MNQEQEMKATDLSDDEEIEVNPRGQVEMVDNSRLPTFNALWKIACNCRPFDGFRKRLI